VGWGVARGEEDLVGFKKGRGVGEVIENYSFGVMDLFRWYEVGRSRGEVVFMLPHRGRLF
jgi:hypothetical protein